MKYLLVSLVFWSGIASQAATAIFCQSDKARTRCGILDRVHTITECTERMLIDKERCCFIGECETMAEAVFNLGQGMDLFEVDDVRCIGQDQIRYVPTRYERRSFGRTNRGPEETIERCKEN